MAATTAPASTAAPGSPGYDAALLQALAIPPEPSFQALGARVEHVLAPREGLLSEVVTEALSLPEGAAAALLRFGAVHTCPVPPPVPPAALEALPREQAQAMLRRRADALKRFGNSSQARTPQRASEDTVVPAHAYIRLHLHPKRFPACYSVDWKDRIVADTGEFVVVSKPPGVPAAATVDNLLECAPACAAQAIGHPRPLLVTHRLDQCTEGLLVLGKAPGFVRRFNELVKRSSGGGGSSGGSSGGGSSDGSSGGGSGSDSSSSDDAGSNAGAGSSSGAGLAKDAVAPAAASRQGPAEPCAAGSAQRATAAAGAGASPQAEGGGARPPRPLRKFYRAATAAAPPLGLLRHHLSLERRHAGLPTFTIAHQEAVEGSLPAELRVLEVQPIRLSAAAAQQWGLAAGEEAVAGPLPAFECLIELLTGRTHQIRAQLSAVGCPLLGDLLYQPLACPELRQASRLFAGDPCLDLRQGRSQGDGQEEGSQQEGEEGEGSRLLDEPAGGIGLQACRLEVSDACMGGSPQQPAVFEAGPPWWRAA